MSTTFPSFLRSRKNRFGTEKHFGGVHGFFALATLFALGFTPSLSWAAEQVSHMRESLRPQLQHVTYRGLQEEDFDELVVEITPSGRPLVLALDKGQLNQKILRCMAERLPGLPISALVQVTMVIHELTTREIKGADYVPKGLSESACDSPQTKVFFDTIGVMTSASWVDLLSRYEAQKDEARGQGHGEALGRGKSGLAQEEQEEHEEQEKGGYFPGDGDRAISNSNSIATHWSGLRARRTR